MVTETLRLSAHEKFIIDGIRRQAGTVEKAVLELVMNAIEAQLHSGTKPVVSIDFVVENDQARLVVRDLGRGFKNRNEIEQWFAKFGTPHDECPECRKTMKLCGNTFECVCGYKTEGRTWAEFRMGRGQAFSFGRNVWRTGHFRMEYDLETNPDERTYAHKDGTENHVLDFSLQSNLPDQPGCEVTVYFYRNPVGYGYQSLDHFRDSIKHHIEFMEGEITFNGEQINTPASECEWNVETEDAYFMFGKGNKLALYNIGAFVNDHSAADMGLTGVVVSKLKMMVNFARNDVMQSCSVWQRIQIIIRENKIKKVRRASRRLNKDERISTLQDLRYGDADYDEIKNIGLMELTDGKVLSLDVVRRIRSPWTFAKPGDRIADSLMQTDTAICFSQDTLDTLNFSGDSADFFVWLFAESHHRPFGFDKLKSFFYPFNGVEGLASGYKNTYTIIPTSKLSKAERCFLRVMESYGRWNKRTLCIGMSDTANGWTDGSTYIAFNRTYLQSHNPKYYGGAAALVTLAYHEMSHDDDDTGTHNHAVEFYQRYHEITRGSALGIIGELPQKMRNQVWQDHAQEVAVRDAKKKEQRDRALGIKRVVKSRNTVAVAVAVAVAAAAAADTTEPWEYASSSTLDTPTPTPTPTPILYKKKVRRRRRF